MGGRYEIQVLDSYDNKTYPEGQCASVYNQRPPMVNACRKPGEWQTYDIVFTVPRFDKEGKLVKPGYVTRVAQRRPRAEPHRDSRASTHFDRAERRTRSTPRSCRSC